MKPITAVIVGCGHRSRVYAEIALKCPDQLKIVALVDPDKHVRDMCKELYGVPEDKCFNDISEILPMGKIADCVINGTMDKLHIPTSIPLLEQGYDMLLEKPITNNAEELLRLYDVVKKHGNKVMICHVLRYSDFYKTAKEIINSGEIGEVVHVETQERVGVAHNAISFIRGKWADEEKCGSSMLLQKCCHDIDLDCWLNNASKPVKVSSFGGRNFIIPEKALKGAGTRCLVDCPLVDTCQYSAKMMILENPHYLAAYPWQCTGKEEYELTLEEKIHSLKTDNPHGVCVYKSGATVVDHQAVLMQFGNGSTATHTMLCSAQRAGRSLFVLGTQGEIEGWAGDGKLYVRTFDKDNRANIDKGKERVIDFNANNQSEDGGHFGGDQKLALDFVRYMRGEKPSVSCTALSDSINGHICVYAADKAMKESRVVEISEFYSER